MNTEITFLERKFKNPIIPASGVFGFGYEFRELFDLNELGGICLKGTTLEPRYGNPLPRIAECPAGMLNSIGLQNPGVEQVVKEEIPRLASIYRGPIIANIGGHSFEDYIKTAERMCESPFVFAIELNISCPNVKEGGMAFGVNEDIAFELVKQIKQHASKPIIVKLSPNVTDIVSIAKKVQSAGADAISLVNTFVGMRINLKTGSPILANQKGGYSGPGIFPIALRMVYDVAHAVDIPVIGMGGITNAYDVLEMMYAGARLVMVGAQNLVDPYASLKIIHDLPKIMHEFKIESLEQIIRRTK